MITENPDVFVGDFGSPVLYQSPFGIKSCWAILDQPDETIASGRVQSTAYRIEYASGALPGLKNGEVLEIGVGAAWGFDASGTELAYSGAETAPTPTAFRVLGVPKKIDDGAFLEAVLERLT